MRRAIVPALAAALLSAPALADDARFITIEYHADAQASVACPADLLCAVRLQPGERIRDGLNSQVNAWDPHAIYEGDAVQTPLLTFKPAAAGQRANVIVTTNRRTYLILLQSTNWGNPTYVRFAFDAEAHARAQYFARTRPVAAPRPLTVAEQLAAACSWMATNAVGETYNADMQPARWRPVRICHDARATWLALPPLSTVASDLPVLLELTPQGERIVDYTLFALDRIIRVDGVGDGYVLRSGKDALRVYRLERQAAAAAVTPSTAATPPPDATLRALLEGTRDGR
ncbi:MAG: TrbG/VirB9 family P-type conjugative transfer protein [Candidatus Baltobacteraceae bacterium]